MYASHPPSAYPPPSKCYPQIRRFSKLRRPDLTPPLKYEVCGFLFSETQVHLSVRSMTRLLLFALGVAVMAGTRGAGLNYTSGTRGATDVVRPTP